MISLSITSELVGLRVLLHQMIVGFARDLCIPASSTACLMIHIASNHKRRKRSQAAVQRPAHTQSCRRTSIQGGFGYPGMFNIKRELSTC